MEKIKFAVQAVIFNSIGEVLAVSRKDNHEDFGLPGGKVDPEDYRKPFAYGNYSPQEIAIAREVKEETGLIIEKATMTQVFSMHRDGYMGYTYLIHDWEGEFDYDEPHVVKWAPFDEVTIGSFGKWNMMVKDSLDSMGVECLVYPRPTMEYDYIITNEGGYGEYYALISKKGEDRHELRDWTKEEREEIMNMFLNANCDFGFKDDCAIEVSDVNGYTEDPIEMERILKKVGLTKNVSE